ncbi:MAG: hypothetical protein H6Q69_2004 [Firmicutes bacterium]|nr:hypothetical protein [Bacillota bacterium]
MINVLADTTYWRMNNIRDKFFEEEPNDVVHIQKKEKGGSLLW